MNQNQFRISIHQNVLSGPHEIYKIMGISLFVVSPIPDVRDRNLNECDFFLFIYLFTCFSSFYISVYLFIYTQHKYRLVCTAQDQNSEVSDLELASIKMYRICRIGILVNYDQFSVGRTDTIFYLDVLLILFGGSLIDSLTIHQVSIFVFIRKRI